VSIQYLRAIAAAMVLLHHVAWKSSQLENDPLSWFSFGSAGVDLFFVISGYIMCETAESRRVDFAGFMKARFFRIIPLYWLLSLAALAALIVVPGKVNSSGGTTDILNSFLLLPSTDKYLIQNGWTLSYEFLFYGLFALGLSFGKYRYIIPIGAIFAMVVTGLVLEPQGVWGRFLTNTMLLEFVMGILAFHLFRSGFRARTGPLILLTIAAVAGLALTGKVSPEGSRIIGYGLPSLALFIAIRSLEHRTTRFDESLVGKAASALGDSSYSMYLIHPFVLVVVMAVFTKFGLTENGWVLISAMFIGSLAIGWYCHVLIEKPMATLIARKLRARAEINKEITQSNMISQLPPLTTQRVPNQQSVNIR
jgi:peptidoglycan/LPS O-acetylase OafA/YrhL